MTSFFDRRKFDLLLALFSRLQYGRLEVTLPDGGCHEFVGQDAGPHAAMTIVRPDAVSRIMADGKMGFCEAVMEGEIDSPCMSSLIELAVMHDAMLSKQMAASIWRRMGLRLFHGMRRNSKSGAARNIAYHYDLGNEFYAAWLDRTMTYSSAVFDDDCDDLATAQTNKYRRLADLADIQPGDHVLEIGCGWGGFAEVAARDYGAHVHGITLSREQLVYAQKRALEAGLADRVTFELRDYRDVAGSYDAIASIEMFEAVGEKYWPAFFSTVADRLKAGGRAALQIITIDPESFDDYRRNPYFIQRYIFPGSNIPSTTALLSAATGSSDLRLSHHECFGTHYTRTLAAWRERLRARWDEAQALGFEETFLRLFEFYFHYCEGGFDERHIDVAQLTLVKPGARCAPMLGSLAR